MATLLDTVIATNITVGPSYEVEIVDLAIALAPAAPVTLSDRYEIYDIRFSQSLWDAVNNDEVELNNGTDTLTKQEALDWFDAAAGGTATLDDTGQLPPDQVTSAARGFWISCGGDQFPFVSYGGAVSWAVRRYVIFDGTDAIGIPGSVDFMLRNSLGQTASARLYDVTNNTELAIASYTGNVVTVVNVPTSGWSSGPAVISLELKSSGGPPPGDTECYSVKVYYG